MDKKAHKAAEKEVAKAKKAKQKQRKAQERVAFKRKPTASLEFRQNERKPDITRMKASIHEDTGTGREWLECCCRRWIHGECIDDADIGNTTNRVCPLCFNFLF